MSPPDKFRILAVCSGNVCRSPFVELLLGRALESRPEFVVASAGTIARPGQPMTAEMIDAAARFGVPPEISARHEASRLSEETVAASDLILGLTREHRAEAVRQFPAAVRRAFTLNEFARLYVSAESDGGIPRDIGEFVAALSARRGVGTVRDSAGDDIDDPIGLPQAVYERVAGEIAYGVQVVALALANTTTGGYVRATRSHTTKGPNLSFSFHQVQ